MQLPEDPSVLTPDLTIKTTFGGTKTTYSAADLNNGYGSGTSLGLKYKSSELNHNQQYNIEWLKYLSDCIDYFDGYMNDGSGSPEGVITADIGSIYFRTDGGAGTSFYVKESGTGNTGWVGK